MSKLVDLLNPAPTNAANNASSSRPTVSTTGPVHRRNESLSSPLETLSIAATTNAAATQPRAAYMASFPPNPYLNTNPYAIKPQPAPANAQPSTRPTNGVQTSTSPTTNAENIKPSKPSPSPSPATGAEQASSPAQKEDGSTTMVVKKESPDEQLAMNNKPAGSPAVKIEGAGQETEAETKEAVPAEVKPIKEPKKSTAATKKGTAKAKKDTGDSSSTARKATAAARKRKLEPESKDGTPFSQRSGTPNSRASKTPAQKRTPQQSPGPQVSDNADDDYDAASGEEDGEVYCICRRGDDHTWMIGCDGGCEDWFHGHCVQIDKNDGPLIDKYICPNCEAAGRGRTMWKPMCRLPGCREPARVAGKKPSKYCSDEHGTQFMRDKAFGKSSKNSRSDDARKRRKANKTDNIGNEGDEAVPLNGEESDGEHQAHLRGGVVKAGELKALVSGVKTVEEFKRLGERLAPVADGNDTSKKDPSGDVTMEDADASNADLEAETAAPRLVFTKQEQAALDASSKQRSKLNSQLSMLTDRDKLLAMVKARHKSVFEELRKKDKAAKDICGYDTRLLWSDEEFNQWRTGEEGKAILASNVLPPPPASANANGTTSNDDDEVGRGVCKRKRCERHKAWAKLEQQEINLARSQCWHQMRKLDRDEEELRDRALMRQREAR